jgi:hypothetical protein
MKRVGNLWQTINIWTVKEAALEAASGKKRNAEINAFMKDFEGNCRLILERIRCGYYLETEILYRPLVKVSFTGKIRNISCCSFEWRVLMHVILALIRPKFMKALSDNAYNCVPGRGITCKTRKHSLVWKLGKDVYHNKKAQWYVKVDIKNCYASTRAEVVWKAQERLFKDPQLLGHLRKVSMCHQGLPIGTPLSPVNHHIVMMSLDRHIQQGLHDIVAGYHRYADDIVVFARTKEDAKRILAEIKIWMHRELGYRLKRNIKLCPISVPIDMGGYVFIRNKKTPGQPGYVRLRKSIKNRAKKRMTSKEAIGSYYGLICHCSGTNLWKVLIEKYIKNKKLMKFAENIKTRRDIKNIKRFEMKDILGKDLLLVDFDLRQGKGDSMSVGMILAEKLEGEYTNPFTSKTTSRYSIFRTSTSSKSIIEFLVQLQDQLESGAKKEGISLTDYKKKELPMTGVVILDNGGYYFKGSVDFVESIEGDDFSDYIN